MKHLILISLLVLSVTFVKAQGNLQFNRVITEVLSNSSPSVISCSNNYELVFTVPVGKVWKVEFIRTGSQAQSYVLLPGVSSYCSAFLSGGPVNVGMLTTNTTSNPGALLDTPVWLKEGTKISFWGTGLFGVFSAIEFNIVP